ncbi:twin-arginine translocation protein, TatA/E family subunit [Thermaerobacter marianensis DSM 12885]|uniref:Sec-independent protein translocase protein TatA n=1 Tax=Thermaerobacter marianensis (strain ATCC 700841 / DSM 12885 / JCM 10246 / 7p75a) TaxID=644966 RepID=E6SMK3_THEM7|nr:twin-arginine translocase TatA/TatE family subunit [Thermaerobacter marianensis]ADU51495.1 twin-arginine translocation protein, TatA/E family subunit [Thermaerobacter marianensis DSM 12885]
MGQIGLPEILIIGLVALVIFGPARLPELGRSLGRAMREFRAAVRSLDEGEVPPAGSGTAARQDAAAAGSGAGAARAQNGGTGPAAGGTTPEGAGTAGAPGAGEVRREEPAG